jgi:hypothetical protein
VEIWTRRSDKHSVTFESGWTPPDRAGKQRKVGLPFGIYPRLIFSWLTTQAVLTGSPDLSFGPSFMGWIRDGLHVIPSRGPRGTISLIREQMTRILAMKITVITHQAVSHLGRSQILSGSFSVLPVAGEAAFWDSELLGHSNKRSRHLREAVANALQLVRALGGGIWGAPGRTRRPPWHGSVLQLG